jgi:hypothetical protein
MLHKIYISIIVILVSVFSFISYTSSAASSEQMHQSDTLKMIMASERKIWLEDRREWKACNVSVIDRETNRQIASNRFIVSKDGTCPDIPQKHFISKDQYIKDLQLNEGYGVFDDDSIYPIAIENAKLQNLVPKSNSPISLAN